MTAAREHQKLSSCPLFEIGKTTQNLNSNIKKTNQIPQHSEIAIDVY